MTALAKGEVAAPVLSEILRSLVLLLAPFAPYLCRGDVAGDWRRGRDSADGVAEV